MHTHDIPHSPQTARKLHLGRRVPPETTRSSILELAAHDLDAAFGAARRHIRAHPDDAQLLGQLASATPTDPNASTKFRRFIRAVIADAIADERGEQARRIYRLHRPAHGADDGSVRAPRG